MDLTAIVSLFREGGAIAVLAFFFWLLLVGKLRVEREYLDMKEQRDLARAGEREATTGMKESTDVAADVVFQPRKGA